MKVKIVFHSMYGHIYRTAGVVVEGVHDVEGADVELLQVPALVPDEALEKSGAQKAREAFAHVPTAKPEDLAEADAVIFGIPARFGNMCAQMRNFLDHIGGLSKKCRPILFCSFSGNSPSTITWRFFYIQPTLLLF
jgi:NAD(P)H dehydrogenase (quinone)